MKKQMTLIVTVIILIFGTMVSAEMPSPDPDALWGHITKESPYTKWGFWPDHQGMQPGRAPHGPLHKVFVNDRALNSSQPPVQYGSIYKVGDCRGNFFREKMFLLPCYR